MSRATFCKNKLKSYFGNAEWSAVISHTNVRKQFSIFLLDLGRPWICEQFICLDCNQEAFVENAPEPLKKYDPSGSSRSLVGAKSTALSAQGPQSLYYLFNDTWFDWLSESVVRNAACSSSDDRLGTLSGTQSDQCLRIWRQIHANKWILGHAWINVYPCPLQHLKTVSSVHPTPLLYCMFVPRIHASKQQVVRSEWEAVGMSGHNQETLIKSMQTNIKNSMWPPAGTILWGVDMHPEEANGPASPPARPAIQPCQPPSPASPATQPAGPPAKPQQAIPGSQPASQPPANQPGKPANPPAQPETQPATPATRPECTQKVLYPAMVPSSTKEKRFETSFWVVTK